MKNKISFYIIFSIFCLFTTPLGAQDDCGDIFENIKKYYDAKNWKAAKAECLSYKRHCGSNAQVEQILKECDEHNRKKSASKSLPKQKEVKRFQVDKKYLEFPELGGEAQIKITADELWDITDAPGWVELEQIGNSLIIYCEANYYMSARESEIVLADNYGNEQHVRVFQDRNNDYIRLSANIINAEGPGEKFLINVNSNKPWYINSCPLWCNIEKYPDKIKVSVERNYTGNIRKGGIEIVAESNGGYIRSVISVKQDILNHYLVLSHTSFVDDVGKGSASMPIKVDTDYGYYSIENVPSWCEIVDKTSTSFSVKILRNRGGERKATMAVKAGSVSKNFHISQVARTQYVDVNPSVTIWASKDGGYKTYTVETNCGAWRVVNLPDWCELTNQTENTFTINFQSNQGPSREATFSVSTNGDRCNLTIKQD